MNVPLSAMLTLCACSASSSSAATVDAATDSGGATNDGGGEVLTTPGPCPPEAPWPLPLKRAICERDCSAERATLYYCILGGTAALTCYKEWTTGNLYFASAGTFVPGFGPCTEEEHNRVLNALK